ncbi:MAG: UDP-glucose/GDP-mannose dehydrogenase [Rhodospirillales bacterium]|nr:UDP-glucose/GDP-mannose dehydrogenase [Rhodospirillales bacterium]
MTMTSPLIGFAGMTHLGLNSAVAGAERGFHILAFDQDAARVAALTRGEMPVLEPRLDTLAEKNRRRITFTADPTALTACDLVYVAPDIATDDTGTSDLGPLNELLDLAMAHARPDSPVIVLSQVPPGYTRARQVPGRTLIYQVETLVFGRAIERALEPERYIIGLADPSAPLPDVYADFLRGHGNPPLLPMRYESAELAKISINCCLVATVSTANMLAELCEALGADWSEIAPALRLDRRIGAHAYLAPGLGLSGGNLERDLATVLRLADDHGTDAGVAAAWLTNSRHRKEWSYRTLRASVLDRKPDARIAVLGLAYKEDTHSIKNSPSIECLRRLERSNVAVFDPVVKGNVVPFARDAASALDCARDADVLLILTPWAEFKTLAPDTLAHVMQGRVLIDPYRCLSRPAAEAAGFRYFTLGASADIVKAGGNA